MIAGDDGSNRYRPPPGENLYFVWIRVSGDCEGKIKTVGMFAKTAHEAKQKAEPFFHVHLSELEARLAL